LVPLLDIFFDIENRQKLIGLFFAQHLRFVPDGSPPLPLLRKIDTLETYETHRIRDLRVPGQASSRPEIRRSRPIAAGLLSTFPVMAQQVRYPSGRSGRQSTVTVTGVRRAAQSAQKIKKDADNVIDSIVADDIGKFPDTNVAETMARVTGVQCAATAVKPTRC
jgi:hypothetical protein